MTGLSNVFSSIVVVIVLLFLTPLLYYLPQAVLAAIIMMAVIGLLNVSGFVHAWQTNPFDGLLFGHHLRRHAGLRPAPGVGHLLGVVLSLGGYLYRSMRPHVVRLAPAATEPCVTPFGTNSGPSPRRGQLRRPLEFRQHQLPGGQDSPGGGFPSCAICSSRAKGSARSTPRARRRSGTSWSGCEPTQIAFTDLSDEVLDVLQRSHLYDVIGEDNIFATDVRAIAAIYAPAHRDPDEVDCPFLDVVPRLSELRYTRTAHSKTPIVTAADVSPRGRDANRKSDQPGSVRYVEEWVLRTNCETARSASRRCSSSTV